MKITILGAGRVGSTAAYLLMEKGLADEIVLIDIEKDKVEGESLDLAQCVSGLKEDVKVTGSDDYADSADSDIVIVTAGVPRKPGDTRLDLMKKNAGIIKKIVEDVMAHNDNPIILVVSNPVDVMTYIAYMESGLPKERVFGLGTMLDTIRLRSAVAADFGVDSNTVEVFMLGEHGDSMFPQFGEATIGGTPILKVAGASPDRLKKIFQFVRDSAEEVIRKKGGTFYAPGYSIAVVVEALVYKGSVLPASVYNEEWGVCVSVPCKISTRGAMPLPPKLSDKEKKLMDESIAVLKGSVRELENV